MTSSARSWGPQGQTPSRQDKVALILFLETFFQEHDSPRRESLFGDCALDSTGPGRRSPEEDASKDIMAPRRPRPGELHFWEMESGGMSLPEDRAQE